jgi:DNA-binding CsgD family transcriptional regulator
MAHLASATTSSSTPAGGRRPPVLAATDVKLLECVSFGLTDEQIAAEAGLSPEAVRANLRRVVRSLEARNRAHAVAIALKAGLID